MIGLGILGALLLLLALVVWWIKSTPIGVECPVHGFFSGVTHCRKCGSDGERTPEELAAFVASERRKI